MDTPVADGGTGPGMLTYRAYVQDHASGPGRSPVFVTRKPEHAALTIKLLFAAGRNQIRIVTNHLEPALYGSSEVTDAAVSFLARNPYATLEIGLEDPSELQGHPLLSVIRRAGFFDRVHMFQVPPEVQRDYPFNFVVADGRHYRFEHRRESVEAAVQFNDESNGSALDAVFNQLASLSAPVKVPV
jgi:hypothetical protein